MPKEKNARTSVAIPAEPEKDSPIAKASGFKQLTVNELEHLALQDPDKAQTYLDIYEKLAKRKLKEVDEEALIKTQIMLLERIQAQARIDYETQLRCARNGHSREDNRTALVGQRDNFHELLLVCQRCQQIYHGIGEGTGQLPPHLAQTLDTSLIGGVQ